MDEIWKDIPGFEGRYQVSDLGRIKSLERKVFNSGVKGDNKFYTIKETIRVYTGR